MSAASFRSRCRWRKASACPLILGPQPPLAQAPLAGCRMRRNMQQERPWPVEEEHEAANRQTASLAGVAITLLLLVVGLFLVRELHAKVAVEDCLMAGRIRCDQLVQGHFQPPD